MNGSEVRIVEYNRELIVTEKIIASWDSTQTSALKLFDLVPARVESTKAVLIRKWPNVQIGPLNVPIHRDDVTESTNCLEVVQTAQTGFKSLGEGTRFIILDGHHL